MPSVTRKYAHTGGVVSLAYSPDGALLYTTGGETFIRAWSGDPNKNDDDALQTIDFHDYPVLGLDCSVSLLNCRSSRTYKPDDRLLCCFTNVNACRHPIYQYESLITACEDGTVALFSHSTHDFTSYVTRSDLGLSARAVRFSPNGQRVVVSSDEPHGKVIDVRDISKIQLLEGHSKGIRSASWSPDGQLVTTSSSDGTIRVWDVSDTLEQEPTCIKVLDGFISAEEPESELQCEAVWHPTGRYFVVGSKSHEIAIISRETWEQEGAFDKEGHVGEIAALSFSPNGRYLCSAGRDKAIIIWDTTTRRTVVKDENPSGLVTSLAWRPGSGSNSISYIDNQGHVTRWDSVIDDELPHPVDAPRAGTKKAVALAADHSEGKASRHYELDDDDLDLAIGGNEVETKFFDDEDDFIEDDEDDGVYQSRRPRGASLDIPPALSKGRTRSSITLDASTISSGSLVRGQSAFQPGATPAKEKRRYLAFNMVGVIHTVERETHNIVNIDFHDQTSYPSTHFDDYAKFDLGCLGLHGAAYATSRKDLVSTIAYKPFETWANSQGEWSLDLPADEQVTCLAIGGNARNDMTEESEDPLYDSLIGSGSVVAATTKHYLRFLSGTGTQLYLMNFGEEIVTMSAGKEWIVVVHRSSDIITPGYQDLRYTIIDLDTYEFLQRGKIPLSKGTTLQWIGFAADQTPYMYDSDGLLSCLDRFRRPGQARWVPMLDSNTLSRREGKQESYWPVGITADNFICVILKGGDKHPFFPTPITQELPLQLPLLNMTEKSGEFEAKLIQQAMLAGNARDSLPVSSQVYSEEINNIKERIKTYDLDMDKSILMLIQIACKADKQQQALDLAKLLTSTRSFAGAVKIASAYSLTRLKERFEAMQDIREGTHGSSLRSQQEKQKRDGKYAHLVDLSVIPDSGLEVDGVALSSKLNSSSANLLSAPFDQTARPRKTAKSVFSDLPAKISKPLLAERSYVVSGNSADSDDGDGPMRYDEAEEDEGVSQASLDHSREPSIQPEQSSVRVVATNSNSRFNPFAKGTEPRQVTALVAVAAPLNPFAKKVAHGPNNLKKTGSFFDRVDASNGSTPAVVSSHTQASGSGRQSTLFGLPGAAAKPHDKASKNGEAKKRKSDATTNEVEDEVSVGTVRKMPKKLDGFFKKGLSAIQPRSPSAPPVNENEELTEEDTQIIPDESTVEVEETSATLEKRDDNDTGSATVDEENSIDTNDPVTPAEEAPLDSSKDLETADTEDGQDGLSKLDAFRFKASAGSVA